MDRHYTQHNKSHHSSFRGRYSGPRYFVPPQTRTIPPPLGLEIAKKELDRIDSSSILGEVEISECEFVASYNLLEGLQKTIFIPGRPPIWTPLPGPTILQPDSGEYYRDDNAVRFPEYPMEPAVRSIFQMNRTFNPSEVDVFGCGSTLGDILRFCMGTPQPFSFIVHVVGETAFFLRRNLSATEKIDNVHGYGHSFPEAYTTWNEDAKGSHSHQRIIKYSFGGLRFVVRFEADGYILDQADDFEAENRPYRFGGINASKSSETSTVAIDKLLEGFMEPPSSRNEQAGEPIVIRAKGRCIPQSSIFDLKTRSSRKQQDDIMAEQMPRLWVRQIPKFILAFHTSGRFDPPDVLDITSEMYEWEQKSETALRRMAALIKDIRDTAIATEDGKLEVRGTESSTLQLNKLSASEARRLKILPEELRKQWMRN